jgi:transglutaminase-like putative cysteine protease/lipoprotein NlpI
MNCHVLARTLIWPLICVFVTSSTASGQNVPDKLNEVQLEANAFSLGDPIPAWVEPAAIPSSTRTDPVVNRLADTQWLVGSTPVIHIHRAVMVNDSASLSSAGQLPIAFAPEYQRLHIHALKVHRGDDIQDRTSLSNIRFLQRERRLEQGVYSGVVTASVLVSDLRVGDTLEYAYSIEGENPVFDGKFFDGVGWDQMYPTLLRRVVLNIPADRHISWRLIGDGSARPVVPEETTRDGMRKLRFVEESLPAVTVEPYTPVDYAVLRWLQFSEFSGWDEVSAWAGNLFKTDGALDPALREIVRQLRAKPTAEERVSAALELVQTQIRYFSASLGESSHRPTAPNVVFQRRYGDCKDKSLLLITLLRELGIESNAVLVRLGRHKGLEKLLPSPGIFDHAIVQVHVDGREYYLDPTRLGQHGRLARMGQDHERAQVLLVTPQARELMTIASPNAIDLTRNDRIEAATLPTLDGDGRLEVTQVWRGVIAEGFRVLYEHWPREQIVKTFRDALEPRYPGATLVGEPRIDDDRNENVVTVTTTYNVPKLANERDGNWFVRFRPTNLAGMLVASPSSTRTAPLHVPRFPYAAKYSIQVTFPEDISSIVDPRSDKVESKYFTYAVTSSFRGNVAKTDIELQTLSDEIAVEDLQRFTDDMRAVDNISRWLVYVPKSIIRSANAETKNFAYRLRDRLVDAIEQTGTTIKSGKLAGKDLADAYCDRGLNHSLLGNREEAIRDITESINLAPNKELDCRAQMDFNFGEFEQSVADYSRAIRLGATKPRTYYLRGISNYLAGKLEDAASDFARGAETKDKEQQLYSDLWLTWTNLRLGRAMPEATTQRAAAEPQGGWPRPALAMLAGLLTPDQVLQLLDGKSGDERDMALAEGYFYVGEHYLAHGDKARAREFFEKARQLGVILYLEHVAAGAELQQLKRGTEESQK